MVWFGRPFLHILLKPVMRGGKDVRKALSVMLVAAGLIVAISALLMLLSHAETPQKLIRIVRLTMSHNDRIGSCRKGRMHE